MFYDPRDGHGLPHNPFNAIVAPRPIGWVSSRSPEGIANLAPYSFFNAVAYEPPQVMFASTAAKPDQDDTKDSVANIRATGQFCVNIVSYDLRHAMNATSQALDKDISEFTFAGLQEAPCGRVACPRVADAPASLECRLTQVVPLAGTSNFAVFGEVIGVHIRDDCLVDGRFDVTRFRPLSRLGYRDYAVIDEVFTLARPDDTA